MGYNGGINKRGYYRRYNGMYSKSSYRSGSKLLSNTVLGGLGLIGAGVSAFSELADSAPEVAKSDYKHFSPKRHRVKYIICGIIALLCPIASFATFTFASWPIFFSILLFGIIEIIPCAASCSLENDLTYDTYYYQNEVDEIISKCKRSIQIYIGFLIALFILNLYPSVYLILDLAGEDYYEWWGFGSELTMLLYVIKIFFNGFFIYMAFNELKLAEQTIRDNALKEKQCKPTKEYTQESSVLTNVVKDSTNQQDNPKDNSTKNVEEQPEETIDLVVDQRILNIIKKEHSLEITYYYGEKRMTEDSFNNQQFSLEFKKKWFTYEEYKNYWNEVHHELSVYSKAHILAIDIITQNAILLEDFKEVSVFEAKRDELLNQRLDQKEQKVLKRLQNVRKFCSDCLIFSYRSIRDIKLEAQEDMNKALFSLEYAYERCLKECLNLWSLSNFHQYYVISMDVKYGLQLDSKILESAKAKSENQPQHKRLEISTSTTYSVQPHSDNSTIGGAVESDIKLPSISGEYVEPFKYPYGKLHIDSKGASIRFYFPGPDARYKGTHFNIWEEDIDKYIQAYQNNWKTATQLREKAKETPKTELKQVGEMRMNIVATSRSFTIYLHQYHLPIYYKKDYEDMVMLLKRAKLRIKEVRSKLFV